MDPGAESHRPAAQVASEPGIGEQRRMVEALRRQLQLSVGDTPVELIETHISWVLVAGRWAWKIKKAVELGFVDFTTLERRRHFCDEELRLNRRLAPTLYLDVVPITGSADAPRLGGGGPPLEFAVRMHAFAQDVLWDRLARARTLSAGQIDELAEQLARFHDQAAAAPACSPLGEPSRVRQPVAENLAALDAAPLDARARAQLAGLRDWEQRCFVAIEPLLEQRRTLGRVRECHGDLHLGNVAQVDGRCTVFDGIDFNDDLRFIDVISDVAFMAMDLHHHRLPGLARRFVNQYLERSGDYAGARLLRYYAVYRALVRAKIAWLRGREPTAAASPWREDLQAHLLLALSLTGQRPDAADTLGDRWPAADLPPAVLITHGLSGSGKTTGTQQLIELAGALRVRSDVERQRLFARDERYRGESAVDAGSYAPQATEATYQRLFEAAQDIVGGGYAAVLDATWLRHGLRLQARTMADRLGVPFVILDFAADPALLVERIRRRQAEGHDASQADVVVLEAQQRSAQPLTADERPVTLACPASLDRDGAGYAQAWHALADSLRQRLHGRSAATPSCERWFAMQLSEPAAHGRTLQQVWRDRLPQPGPGQVRIQVRACGVCRTDLHIVDGELAWPGHAVVPGHEIVGRIAALGPDVPALATGQRVGVPWLGWTCGVCDHCRAGRENLCEQARFTGWQIAGGYAQQVVADARYVFPLPERYSDLEAAPLLCAGLIGWRAFTMAGRDAQRLGIYGFGAAAHLIAQVAVHLGREVYAFTREGDAAAQQLARELGACWAGSSAQRPSQELDAALIFAPVGALVPAALRALRPGGTVVCAGIHMSDIPSFPYAWLWGERRIVSVANLTRADGEAFLRVAGEVPLKVHVRPYRLDEANMALDDLRAGRFSGAAVLQA